MWVFDTTVVEHLNAVLVASGSVKSIIKLNKYCQIIAIVFTMTILSQRERERETERERERERSSIQVCLHQVAMCSITHRVYFESPC